jgi:hypothetical protein
MNVGSTLNILEASPRKLDSPKPSEEQEEIAFSHSLIPQMRGCRASLSE